MLAQVARGGHAYRLYDRCQDAQPGDGLVDEREVEPAVTEDARMPWLITPHEGVSDLKFAMDRDVVEAIMGAPASVRITRTGRMRLEYGQASPALVFVDDSLVEINFLPEVSGGLVLDGLDLLASVEHDVVGALRQRDDAARERLGFIIFPRLGIALSGFEPPEDDQRAVIIFGPSHPWSK